MYKTVVFDLDGTLLNTLTDLADAGNRLCRKYGWPTHERQAYRYFVGNGIPKLVERLAPADQRTPAVLEAALADFKRDYGQHLRDTTAPYPGIPEMLAKLKANGVQLAVFSNKADALAKEVVKDYFGTQYFTIVRGQMTGVAPKPAAGADEELMEKFFETMERPAAGPACRPGQHPVCGGQQRGCGNRPQCEPALLRGGVGIPHAGGTECGRGGIPGRKQR